MSGKKEKPLHSGHRQRMMERLAAEERFQDHEILEVLLFNAIPRSNTNPIAHALINAFGSLRDVFRASIKELMLVDGVGKNTAEYIRCVGLCFDKIDSAPKNYPLYFSTKAFLNFLEEEYKGKIKEVLEIFCLDKLGRIFFRKEFSTGKTEEVKVAPTDISELLLVKKPFTVVVAHNHPYGTRNPSVQDDVFTKQICMICLMHNTRLGDHIIVGRDGLYSYHTVGKLDKICNQCKTEMRLDGGSPV